MKRDKRALRMEIKQVSEAGSFEGILATYNNVDLGGDVIEPGAFNKTIAEHGPTCKLLWQHEPGNVIGTLLLIDGPDALRVKGQIELDDDIPFSKTAYKLLKKKLLSGLSIGYDTIKDEVKNGVRYLKELRLWEGSLVTFPMNEMATVTSVKARTKDGFADEYNENVVMAAPFQMLDALTESLFDLLYAGGLSSDELTQAATLALQEFQDAWLEWLPLYLGLIGLTTSDGGMSTMARRGLMLKAIRAERKEGRRYSAATKSMMKDCHGSIKNADSIMHALLDPAADDEEENDSTDDVTPEAKAARRNPEPVEDHSAAQTLVGSIRSLISAGAAAGK